MSDTLQSQLTNLHQLFKDASPTDPKVISDFGWTVVKILTQQAENIDSFTSRQLLADCIQLPIAHPSKLHSALLSAAVKVAGIHNDFRFAAFLKLWGIQNLRPEDSERQHAAASGNEAPAKSFPSLVERTAKAFAHSLLLHPEDAVILETAELQQFLTTHGYSIHQMLVTRVKEAQGKDGRKYIFVTLTSSDGVEVECVSGNLLPHPFHPLPKGKRHFVNIGQLYDCLLKTKATVPNGSPSGITLAEAYLSERKPIDVFPTEMGFVESIDPNHGQMHIYDRHSRHFVAHVLRFSKEKAGDFVRFIPIVPQTSKFKTAIILNTVPSSSYEVVNIHRPIRITSVNKAQGYAAWELLDKEQPITELLSPLQLSQGETSPSYTSGYLNLAQYPQLNTSNTPLQAFIYLRRGKDKLKRPYVARIVP